MERAGIDIVSDGEIRRESYSNYFGLALDCLDSVNVGSVIGANGRATPVPRVTGRIRRKGPVERRDAEWLPVIRMDEQVRIAHQIGEFGALLHRAGEVDPSRTDERGLADHVGGQWTVAGDQQVRAVVAQLANHVDEKPHVLLGAQPSGIEQQRIAGPEPEGGPARHQSWSHLGYSWFTASHTR